MTLLQRNDDIIKLEGMLVQALFWRYPLYFSGIEAKGKYKVPFYKCNDVTTFAENTLDAGSHATY